MLNTALPWPSRLLRRLIDPRHPADLALASVFGGLPMLLAWQVGVAHLQPFPAKLACATGACHFPGYFDKPNWTGLCLILPFILYAMRWAIARIAPVHADWPVKDLPDILNFLPTEAGRREAYEALRASLLAPRLLWIAGLLALAITLADMFPLLALYARQFGGGLDPSSLPAEATLGADWSMMFLNPVLVGPAANFTVVVAAYAVQTAAIFLGLLFVLLCLGHNLFLLGRIYQRRRQAKGSEQSYIVIDLDDPERCFGFRRANRALNTQILSVGLAGIAMIASRFTSVWSPLRNANVEPRYGVLTDPALLFPVAGQWAMPLALLVALLLLSLPAAIKLLPLLPMRRADGQDTPEPDSTAAAYLREFFPDAMWPYGSDPSAQAIDFVASKFAANAFWPTGNNRAVWLFRVSYFFLAVITLPCVKPGLSAAFAAYLVAAAALAFGLTMLTFAVLHWVLAAVDTRLVSLPKDPVADPLASGLARRSGRIRHGVFISYRRADTLPYAGRLDDTLSPHLHSSGKLFRDLDTIAVGANFVDAIQDALKDSRVAIVLIGRLWATIEDGQSRRRLHDPADLVRSEVATALRLGLKVVPVLVGGAQMPGPNDLPDDLAPLLFLNALEITDLRWEYDVERLLDAITDLPAR